MIDVLKAIVLLVVLAFCGTRIVDWVDKRNQTHPKQVIEAQRQIKKTVSGVKGVFKPVTSRTVLDAADGGEITIIEETGAGAEPSNVKKIQKIVEAEEPKAVDYSRIYNNLQKADEVYSTCND